MYKFYTLIGCDLSSRTKYSPPEPIRRKILNNSNLKYWFMRINLTCILLLFIFLQLSIAANGQYVTLVKNQVSISELFKEIKKQTNYDFVYKSDLIKTAKRVDIDAKNEPLVDVLNKVFENQPFTYFIKNNAIIVVQKDKIPEAANNPINIVNAPNEILVTGKVVDTIGAPLAGATIRVKNGTAGTATDINGKFKLNVPDNSTLVFSFIGYVSVEQAATQNMVVKLKPDKGNLSDVVVVGYGTQRKANLTGAIEQISGKEIAEAPVSTLADALAGRLPGLVVMQNSGEPGYGAPAFNIRGLGNALVIVDGVPGYAGTITPADIETISTIKDASASIYGFGAVNGAIIITTKKGSTHAPVITYDGSYSLQNPTTYAKLLNAGQFTMLQDEAAINNEVVNNQSISPTYGPVVVAKWAAGGPGYQSTNWYNLFIQRNAPMSNQVMSITGGSDNIKYYFSGSYVDQDGMWPMNNNAYYKKYTVTSNLSAKISNNITGEININGAFEDLLTPQNSNPGAIFSTIERAYPIWTAYTNGNPAYLNNNLGGQALGFANEQLAGVNNNSYTTIRAQASLSYNVPFINGLVAKVLYSYNPQFQTQKQNSNPFNLYNYDQTTNTYSAVVQNPIPTLTIGYVENLQIDQQSSLKYTHNFGEKHALSILAVYDRLQNISTNLHGSGNYALPGLTQLQSAIPSTVTAYSGDTETADAGYAGKINYAYDNKYLVEFGGRYDGSSSLPPDGRWGFFPYASAGWVITQEPWFKINAINNLKIRASWGQLGSISQLSGNQYYAGFNYPGSYPYNFQPGVLINALVPTSLPNYLLTWVKSTSENIGFDANLFNNSISVSGDWFSRKFTGLPGNSTVNLPSTAGFGAPQVNLYSNQTRGFEFSFAYNGHIKDISFSITPNISYTRTENLYATTAQYSNSLQKWTGGPNNRYTDITWGYEYIGQFTSMAQIAKAPIQDGNGNKTLLPGDLEYKDVNHDGVISGADEVPIGRGSNPDMNYGLNITATWKNFDFSVLGQGSADYSVMLQDELQSPFFNQANTFTYFLDRWHHENIYDPNSPWTPGKYPSTRVGGTTSNDLPSTFWLTNVWYLRLKSTVIGYSLSKNFVKKLNVKQIRVYFTGQDLITLTNLKYFDPEMAVNGGSTRGQYYPQQRVLGFGVQVKL